LKAVGIQYGEVFQVSDLHFTGKWIPNPFNRTIKTPLEVPAASSHACAIPNDEDCILKGIEYVPKPPVGKAAGGKIVEVFGIDLSEYVQAPSYETPFERFLRDEDRLGEMASQPWVGKGHKL
jgi:hypothetical protein